jgi:hypothetical protein
LGISTPIKGTARMPKDLGHDWESKREEIKEARRTKKGAQDQNKLTEKGQTTNSEDEDFE